LGFVEWESKNMRRLNLFGLHLPTLGVAMAATSAALISFSVAAKADLGPSDISAIQSAVSSQITQASQGGSTSISAAIQAVLTAEIGQFGEGNAQDIVDQVIIDAISDGASDQQIGQALADAALALGSPAGDDIATALGAYGDSQLLTSFDSALANSPNGAAFATEADNSAHGGQPGGSVSVGGGATGSSSTGSGPPCSNPSCT
jgi:hypothetical protein